MKHLFSGLFLTVLSLLLFTSACGSDDAAPAATATTNPDGEWILESLVLEQDMAIPLPDQPLNLRIDGTEIGGSAGCNSMGGTASFDRDGSLSIEELFATEMACTDMSVMNFEQTYLRILNEVDSWTIAEDRLQLTGPNVELHYIVRVAPADLPIIGTTWTLDTFFDGETASNSAGMSDVMIRFSDSGVTASGPCWTISGFATIEPGGEGNLTVDFSSADPGFSCEDRGLFEDVMARLNPVTDYRVDESRLTLGASGQDLMSLTGAG